MCSVRTTIDESKPAVPFEIITRDAPDKKSAKFVDVAYQQSLPENRNAVFQVASNFNGVEAINEDETPDKSNFAENYINDRTQGPAASISAGAAAITRIYAPFYDPDAPQATWTQTASRQVCVI